MDYGNCYNDINIIKIIMSHPNLYTSISLVMVRNSVDYIMSLYSGHARTKSKSFSHTNSLLQKKDVTIEEMGTIGTSFFFSKTR